jgi:GAF domain-containing protein
VTGASRRLALLDMLRDAAGEVSANRVCAASVEVTAVTGAGLMLMTEDVHRGSICSTNDVSATIERLQYDLGEGPCLDAARQDRPIAEPDLGAAGATRWPAFTPQAVAAGARAVFGFPLQVGAVRLGALNLYRDEPGALTDRQHADALLMAGIAAEAVLVLQAGAPDGQLASELEIGADFQYVVHQAGGMIAAQLEVTVATALVRLRAYAFGNERTLVEVARDVVARRLRFDEPSGENDAAP